MTLMEHLEELRGRLVKSAIAFAIGSVVAWFLYDYILTLLLEPLRSLPEANQLFRDGNLIITAPTEGFFVRLKVTAFAGLFIALPVILWQVWRFITPGLYAHEKRWALPFVAMSLVLFGGGAAFAFFMLPKALEILIGFAGSEMTLLPKASEYLTFVLVLVAAFGFAFEFPLVLLSLSLIGVITPATLSRGRRVAWVIILIAAAIITPTQDPITLMIMSIPLAILYELTVLAARLLDRTSARRRG